MHALSKRSGESLLDWSEKFQINSGPLCIAHNENDVLQFLREHPRTKIRVTGSCYSNRHLLTNPDDEDALTIVVRGHSMDPELDLLEVSPDKVRFTFWPGIKLKDVFKILEAHGRQVPCAPGVISEQSLAGAIATGTHGQGLDQCGLSDVVIAGRLATVDGDIMEVTPDDDLLFKAFRINLGCMGIATAITLTTIPYFEQECHKRTVTADVWEKEFVHFNRIFKMCKAWWFAEEEQVHLWVSGETGNMPLAELRQIENCDQNFGAVIDRKLEQMQKDTSCQDPNAKVYQTVQRFRQSEVVKGSIYTIWCKGIPVPQINVEIAVPLKNFHEAVAAIKRVMGETKDRTHYPIILRCTGASDALLSQTQNQDVCHFGFVVYLAEDGSIPREGANFIAMAEKELARLEGRPHWGKYFTPNLYDWNQLYPQLATFRDICRRLDPTERLTNIYTEKILKCEELPPHMSY